MFSVIFLAPLFINFAQLPSSLRGLWAASLVAFVPTFVLTLVPFIMSVRGFEGVLCSNE